MLNSYEVRWMYMGMLPGIMPGWFENFNPELQSPRTDYYFHQTDKSRLGIKLREGSFQVKPKIKNIGIYNFNQHEGKIEQYNKWSYAVENNPEWSLMTELPDVWVPVTKERKIVKYTLEGGYPDQVEMENDVEEGCEIELSTIQIKAGDYWSLAFEAYGTDAKNNLTKTLRHIFETKQPPVPMSLKNSFGYAKLIHDIQP